MPLISLALSEIIKRRLFRAREHLECCRSEVKAPHIEWVTAATYEINRELKLPAVRRESGAATSLFVEDAITNLTTVIDFDLTQIVITGNPDEVVIAAQELMTAIQTIPLPKAPQATR